MKFDQVGVWGNPTYFTKATDVIHNLENGKLTKTPTLAIMVGVLATSRVRPKFQPEQKFAKIKRSNNCKILIPLDKLLRPNFKSLKANKKTIKKKKN